jgi:hypothetical protein
MEDILYCKDLYQPLQDIGTKPACKSDEDWNVMNRKTVGQIRQWIDQSVFHHVAQETVAYTLWTKLEALYERKTTQNEASTIRRLVNLKYRETRNVSKHLSDFQRLINQLTNMKMVLEDELQALLLLSSLPDNWDTLVVSLSNSAPQGVLTLDIVKDSMFNEEARRKEQGMPPESEALVTEYRGRSIHKKFNTRDKSRGSSGDKFKGKSWARKDVECFYCHEKGHMKKECRKLKREQQENGDARNIAATIFQGNKVILVCDDGHVNLT